VTRRPPVTTASGSVGLVLAAVLIGVALRLVQYGIPRALWYDEARNAAEILKDHWLLMLPPHSAQPTAVGFLAIERLFVAILGEGERALRLFPLLAGIAALVVAARLAHRWLGGLAAPLAVALVALSPSAIYFSSEVKPYSSDLLAGLLIAAVFAQHASRPPAGKPTTTQVAVFAALGALAVWLSYTSVFCLAVAGPLLIARTLHERDWRSSAHYAAMGASWLASFALHYQLVIAHWSGTQWLTSFWAAGFPGEEAGAAALVSWSFASLLNAFENPLGATLAAGAVAGLATAAFALGALRALRDRNPLLILFAGVFALAFASALLHLYPFKGRLLLFALPSMAFLVAHGCEWLARLVAGPDAGLRSYSGPAVAVALAATLLAGSASSALRLIALEPLHRHGTVNLVRHKGVEMGFEGVSEVVRYVARNHQPGDVLYLYYSAEPGYAYYARQLGFQVPTVVGVRSQADHAGYARDLAQLMGNKRVWVVFSHTVPAEKEFIVAYLGGVGERLDYYRRPRADAYLFDLGSDPPRRDPR
jgi:hypothetical protein